MFGFFGKFDSVEDLQSRMVNTFAEDPTKWLSALAKVIICEDMKIVDNPEGGITVFWNTGKDESYKWN
jgi:hypothetical protein